MKLFRLPGVHRPVSDTWMLAAAMCAEGLEGKTVLDICTGTGALAISAAQGGAAAGSAVDLTRQAALCARVNSWVNGARVEVLRGDLFGPLAGRRFDIIVSNPPYIPAESDELPRKGPNIPLDAGCDGRALLDRICREAPAHLNPSGAILVVHSSICGTDRTVQDFAQSGLSSDVVVREPGRLGPVMTARAQMIRERGLLGDEDLEEIVVVRGRLSERLVGSS